MPHFHMPIMGRKSMHAMPGEGSVEAAERRSEERKANDARHGLLAGGGLGAIQSKVQSIYKDKTGGAAARFLLETLTYCIFVAFFFSGLLTARHDEQEYYMKQHIAEALLEEEFMPEYAHVREDYFSISKIGDMYHWLSGPFLMALFNEPYFASHESGMPWLIAGQNVLVGPVRLRQVRASTDDSCKIISELRNGDNYLGNIMREMTCYAKTPTEKTIDRNSYPFADQDSADYNASWPNHSAYHYTPAADAGGFGMFAYDSFWGRVTSYPGGGFIDYFRVYNESEGGPVRSAEEAHQLVTDLRDSNWIDEQSRALFVDMLFYNPSVGAFGALRIHAELLAAGGVVPSYSFATIRPQFHQIAGLADYLVIVLQVITYLFVIGYTLEEIVEYRGAAKTIRQRKLTLKRFLEQTELPATLADARASQIVKIARTLKEKLGNEAVERCDEDFQTALSALTDKVYAKRLKKKFRTSVYFEDSWNYVDIVNLSCFWVAIVLQALIAYEVSVLVDKASSSVGNDFINAWPLTRIIMYYDYLQGVNCFLCLYKLFKYLHGVNTKMAQLIQTLSNASTDLMYFVFILTIVLFGFGAMFTCAFGNEVFQFRTITISIMTLMRAIPEGVLFYEDLRDANRFIGPMAYVMYNVLVFLVLMNMFLAIINSSYEEVRQRNLREGSKKVISKRLGQFYAERKKRAQKALQPAAMLIPGRKNRCSTSCDAADRNTGKNRNRKGSIDPSAKGRAIAEVAGMIGHADESGDGDGKVTAAELVSGIRNELGGATQAEATALAEQLMAEFDGDGDGVLDADEVTVARAVLVKTAQLAGKARALAGDDRESRVSACPNQDRLTSAAGAEGSMATGGCSRSSSPPPGCDVGGETSKAGPADSLAAVREVRESAESTECRASAGNDGSKAASSSEAETDASARVSAPRKSQGTAGSGSLLEPSSTKTGGGSLQGYNARELSNVMAMRKASITNICVAQNLAAQSMGTNMALSPASRNMQAAIAAAGSTPSTPMGETGAPRRRGSLDVAAGAQPMFLGARQGSCCGAGLLATMSGGGAIVPGMVPAMGPGMVPPGVAQPQLDQLWATQLALQQALQQRTAQLDALQALLDKADGSRGGGPTSSDDRLAA